MATYNLTTDADVTTLLTGVKSSAEASAINYWLTTDKLMPSQSGTPLNVDLENTFNTSVSPYTLAGSGGLFLFNGPVGQTAYVSDTSGNNILADPGNIVYTGPATGTQGDLLIGGDSSGFLQTLKGNNELIAGTGAYTLIGGSGTDYMYGNMGSDLLAGTTGNTEMVAGSYYQTGAAAETLQGGSGNDFMLGGAAADSLVSTTGNDILVAGLGANTLTGGSGYDSMYSSYSASPTTTPRVRRRSLADRTATSSICSVAILSSTVAPAAQWRIRFGPAIPASRPKPTPFTVERIRSSTTPMRPRASPRQRHWPVASLNTRSAMARN